MKGEPFPIWSSLLSFDPIEKTNSMVILLFMHDPKKVKRGKDGQKIEGALLLIPCY
jgi:hypothetical protein